MRKPLTMSEATASLGHGAHAVGKEVMNLLGDLVAPIAGVGIGWVLGNKLGGQAILGGILWNAAPASAQTTNTASLIHIATGLIFAGVFAGLAWTLWRAGSKMGDGGKILTRFASGLFGGMAVSNFISGVINNKQPSVVGWLDNTGLTQ